jgi:hypothetical protein
METIMASSVPEIVEANVTKPKLTDLRSIENWTDVASTFVPVLKKDMPVEERRNVLRDVAKRAGEMEDSIHAVQGEVLYEISKNAYWREWDYIDDEGNRKEFNTFDEYLSEEVEISRRTAYYEIAVYQRLVIEIGIPADKMRGLEWSKAKEILPVIDDKNWEQLLDDVGGMRVREVKEHVRKLKGSVSPGGSGPATADFERMNFMLTEDQADNVRHALRIAGEEASSDKTGHQLDLMATAYIAEAIGEGAEAGMMRLDAAKQALERAFGVTLEVTALTGDNFTEDAE